MRKDYTTLSDVCGKIQNDVFLMANKRLQLDEKHSSIAHAVLVLGYRQAVVARRFEVSRQWVHSLCSTVCQEIEAIEEKRAVRGR